MAPEGWEQVIDLMRITALRKDPRADREWFDSWFGEAIEILKKGDIKNA